MNILIIGGCGYCGTYLANNLRKDHKVITLDKNSLADIQTDYRNFLDWNEEHFNSDVILWFAGSSSVKESESNPLEALENNCLGLSKLLDLCQIRKKYLIYASSASVYSNGPNSCPPFLSETDLIYPGTNAYDRSKFIMDYIAEGFFSGFLGLRMGTVCGFSSPMRRETLFNSMNLSALTKKKLILSNSSSYRSILFLEDLLNIVKMAIRDRPNGLLNTASRNVTIGEVAGTVSKVYGIDIVNVEGNLGYSFRMDLSKLNKLYSVKNIPLSERCEEFKEQWQKSQTV